MATTKFTITFEDGVTKSLTANYIEPEFVKGWWSYDKEGNEVYEYGEKRNQVLLSEKMYFHVETKGIPDKAEIELKLYDYDYYIFDAANPDDDEFPDKEIIKTVKISRPTRADAGRATLELTLEEQWDIMIKDDSDYIGNLDTTIELYWETKYKNLEEDLPKDKNDYLRVAIERDLYIKPMADRENGLPEIYDSKGHLIIFGLGLADFAAGESGIDGNVNRFMAAKIKITKETALVSEINAVKHKVTYEQIDLDSNKSKLFHYEVIEASDFVIKGDATFVAMEENTHEIAKKFSDYFNAHDVASAGKKLLSKILKVIDYKDMTEALYGMLPKDDGIETPNPINILTIAAIGNPISFPLAVATLTADLLVTPMVKEQIRQLEEDSKRYMTLAKVKGLSAVRSFLMTQSAKIGGYTLIENIPQVTHNEVMKGKINTRAKIVNSKGDNYDYDFESNTYTYIIQKIKTESRLEPIYAIDSIFIE